MIRRRTQSSPRRPRRAGFSFAEVMFAVVILGIGFIMIAAIFPVAIQQTQSTSEESNAAGIAREAANAIASLPTTIANPLYNPAKANPVKLDRDLVPYQILFPPTVKNFIMGSATAGTDYSTGRVAAPPAGVVVPFVGTRWDLVRANAVINSDPRFAYAAFYKRDNNQSTAQLIVLAMASRNRSTFDVNLDPILYSNQIESVSVATSRAGLNGSASTNTQIVPDTISVTGGTPREGSYVTLGTTPAQIANFDQQDKPGGRTYALGRFINGTTYEIQPGEGMALTPGTGGLWGTDNASSDLPLSNDAGTLFANGQLQATVAYAQTFFPSDTAAGRITLYATPGGTEPPAGVGPGAFVIVADDFPFDPANASSTNFNLPLNLINIRPPFVVGSLNGRIFRLAANVTRDPNQVLATDPNSDTYPVGSTYDLDLAYGMRPTAPGENQSADILPNPDYVKQAGGLAGKLRAKVYIIGAGRTNTILPRADAAFDTRGGAAQDIGIYSTFFQVK